LDLSLTGLFLRLKHTTPLSGRFFDMANL
jgi:hypothetical protein